MAHIVLPLQWYIVVLSLSPFNFGARFPDSFNTWWLQLPQVLEVEYKDTKTAWMTKLLKYLKSINNPDDASPEHFDVCSLIYR